MSDDTSAPANDPAADWFPLDELTGRLAGLVWVEQRLAEIFDSWITTTGHAASAVALSRAGKHHDWHAAILGDVLATSPQLAASERIVAPTGGWQRAVDQMLALEDIEARLAAIVHVTDPWLQREIDALQDLANPVSDSEHERLLRFVALDHVTDGEEIAALLSAHQTTAVDLQGRRAIAEIDLG